MIYSAPEPMDPIRVIHHCEDGTRWSESPDAPGWYAARSSLDEVRRLAEEGIRFPLERDDVVVEHYVPAPA